MRKISISALDVEGQNVANRIPLGGRTLRSIAGAGSRPCSPTSGRDPHGLCIERRARGTELDVKKRLGHVLEVLRREKMATFQEVMDEAISDFLKKNNRPVTLKAALKQSAGKTAGGKRRHRKSH